MLIGIGFSNPLLVGLIALALLLFLVFLGVRVVFAAATVGLIGLVELLGWGPAAGIIGVRQAWRVAPMTGAGNREAKADREVT